MQCNEGKWEFNLGENASEDAIVLQVEVGAHIDTTLIKADVQPLLVRLLIKVMYHPEKGCSALTA